MSDIKAVLGEAAVEIELDEGLYPKDAVYGAAYVFIEVLRDVGNRAWAQLLLVLLVIRAAPETAPIRTGEDSALRPES